MRFWTLLFILSGATCFAQSDSILYDELVHEQIGKYYKIPFKSKMTGMEDTLYLKKGEWVSVDSLGNELIKTNYAVNKRKKRSVREGLQLFLDPISGDTLLMRNYKQGRVSEQLALHTGILAIENTIYHIYKDFGSFTVAEYRQDYTGSGDFTTIWKSSIENPTDILSDSNYLKTENELGDPSLLKPATFTTKAEYNYVSNPEFENHPQAYFSIMSFENQIVDWSVASISPDLYLSPSGALSGNSYIGIRVFSLKKDIEYVQNRLRFPLKKDSTYCFSAYLKLSEGSQYASNAFGFLLSKEPVYIDTDQLLKVQPSKGLNTQILNYKSRWMKVQCTYTAIGGEQYLTLGSFQNHKELKLIKVPGKTPESYYYIDDVSLVPVEQDKDCACNFTDNRTELNDSNQMVKEREEVDYKTPFDTLKEGDKLILDNIHFENDEATLLPESYATLVAVVEFMHANKKARVELSGHTSSLGSLRHNYLLSEKRAKAVLKFLVKNGVNEDRVQTAGYGPDYPIASDETAEGQKENRRVEFKILAL